MARPAVRDTPPGSAHIDPDDAARLAELRERRLARARELADKAVTDLQAAGVLDAKGRRVRKDLPPDMRPDSKTDV